MPGPAALILVCLATAGVGVTVASWGFARRGSDAALAASMSGLAYLFLPVHVLGWLGWLTRGALGGTLAAIALALAGATLASPAARARWLETARAIAGLAIDGIREPVRARSATAIGVAAVVLLSAWTAWLAYLTPSSSWDGLAYHEPMIAFALQNEGFAWVGGGAASELLWQVDGFPRLVENAMLVAAVAWDRRVVDMIPSALLPVVVLGVYAFLRRFVASRVLALGLACAFALVPAIVLQLRSTLVDLGFAATCAASFAWACRERPRPSELWQLGLALGLLGASKVTGLFVLPFAAGIAIVAVARGPHRARRLAHLAGALSLCLAMTAPTYVRNVAVTGNPLWPAQIERFGLRLVGPLDLVDQNLDGDEPLELITTVPKGGLFDAGSRHGSYGYVLPLVLPPLAGLGLWLALRRLRAGRDRARDRWLLAVAIPLVAFLLISPARYWARLNLHVVLGALALAGYWLGQPRRARFAGAVVAVLLVGALAFIAYARPHWVHSSSVAWERARTPAVHRAVAPGRVARLLPLEVAIARETQLGPGDLVLVERTGWLGVYWNERFDNRVELLDEPDFGAWLAEAHRRRAEWIVVRDTPRAAALSRDPAWQLVGFSQRIPWRDAIYRRAPRGRLEFGRR